LPEGLKQRRGGIRFLPIMRRMIHAIGIFRRRAGYARMGLREQRRGGKQAEKSRDQNLHFTHGRFSGLMLYAGKRIKRIELIKYFLKSASSAQSVY
jgi:hypothetical protein